MKKIPVFITGCLLALSVCASAMQPQVLLRTGTNYDVRLTVFCMQEARSPFLT